MYIVIIQHVFFQAIILYSKLKQGTQLEPSLYKDLFFLYIVALLVKRDFGFIKDAWNLHAKISLKFI